MVQIANPLVLVPHPHLSNWSPLPKSPSSFDTAELHPRGRTTTRHKKRGKGSSRPIVERTDDESSSLASDSECDLETKSASRWQLKDTGRRTSVPTYKYQTYSPYHYSHTSHSVTRKPGEASRPRKFAQGKGFDHPNWETSFTSDPSGQKMGNTIS
jgi:hypothetical protein